MQPAWTRLNKDDSRDVLDKLSHRSDAVVFSRDVTEVTWRNLACYSNYKLFRLTNFATMPTFTMTYLSNTDDFIALDGTANPIYEANEKDPIQLNEMNVVPYLDFFFANVHGSEGDVFLIKEPRKMPFMETLTEKQKSSIVDNFQPIKVTHDIEAHAFKVSGTLFYGGGLISSTIVVTSDGKLSFEAQNLLLSGIHFPDNVDTQVWAEG